MPRSRIKPQIKTEMMGQKEAQVRIPKPRIRVRVRVEVRVRVKAGEPSWDPEALLTPKPSASTNGTVTGPTTQQFGSRSIEEDRGRSKRIEEDQGGSRRIE